VARALAPYGLQPSAALADAIRAYVELLLSWNRKVNLTAVVNPEEILRRHFGESMFGAVAVPISHGRLVDVGSGAGFPGLAVKMASPDLEVTLVEANLKKAAFLGEVVRRIGLAGITIVTKRISEMKEMKAAADFVTIRAVRPDERLLAWMHGVLKSSGKCVLWLGGRDAEALRRQSAWDWQEPIPVPLSESRVLQIGEPK
jgi:16S rRNA (guanine527-N7)-methyltransferase